MVGRTDVGVTLGVGVKDGRGVVGGMPYWVRSWYQAKRNAASPLRIWFMGAYRERGTEIVAVRPPKNIGSLPAKPKVEANGMASITKPMSGPPTPRTEICTTSEPPMLRCSTSATSLRRRRE